MDKTQLQEKHFRDVYRIFIVIHENIE